MNHLDDGTIHAWLDGALSAEQSRDIEAHVAACATCSAAVAEARGLIAGASRILGALDDVPGGVIPGGAPAAPSSGGRSDVTPIATRRSPRRRWRVTRWASGIAAVLVAAIVLSTSNTVQRSTDLMEARGTAAMEPRVDTSTASTAQIVADTPAIRAPANTRFELPQPAPPASPQTPAPGAQVSVGRARGTAAARPTAANQASKAATPVEQRSVAADVAPSFGEVRPGAERATPSVRQDTTRLRIAPADREVALERAMPISAPPAQPFAASDARSYAGCYTIEAPGDAAARVAQGAVGGAGAPERRAAGRAAAPAAVAAQRRELSARDLVLLVRLDTTRTESGFTVIRVPADSTVGSWRIAGDSAHLDLGARGVVKLSRLQRVDCP